MDNPWLGLVGPNPKPRSHSHFDTCDGPLLWRFPTPKDNFGPWMRPGIVSFRAQIAYPCHICHFKFRDRK